MLLPQQLCCRVAITPLSDVCPPPHRVSDSILLWGNATGVLSWGSRAYVGATKYGEGRAVAWGHEGLMLPTSGSSQVSKAALLARDA